MDMLMLINIQTFDAILFGIVVAVALQMKNYFGSSLHPLSFSYVVAPSTVTRTQQSCSTPGSLWTENLISKNWNCILNSTSKALFPHDKCPYPSEVQQNDWLPGLLDCEYTSTFSATMNDE